jgi:hypothetical protein
MQPPRLELVETGYDATTADGAARLTVRCDDVVPAMLYLIVRSFEEAKAADPTSEPDDLAVVSPDRRRAEPVDHPEHLRADDVLLAMQLRDDGLHVSFERIHGRGLYTDVHGKPDGTVHMQVRHRGRAPLRWLSAPASTPPRATSNAKFFDANDAPLATPDAWHAALAPRKAGLLVDGYLGGALPPSVIGALDGEVSPGRLRVRGGRVGSGAVDLWVAAEGQRNDRIRLGICAPGLGPTVRTWLGGGASPSAARGRATQLQSACLTLGLDPETSAVRDLPWRLLAATAELVGRCLDDHIETALLIVHVHPDDDGDALARGFGVADPAAGFTRGPLLDGVRLWWIRVSA